MNKITLPLLCLGVFGLFTNSIAADSNTNLQTTAKLIPTCTIEAQNINFGVLSAPLTSQSSNSQMNVLCNNNAAFKIDLSYGGIYGQGSTDTLSFLANYSEGYNYYLVSSTVRPNYGGMLCGYGAFAGKVLFSGGASKLYGYVTPESSGWIVDTNKACTSNGTVSGTKPTNWSGAYNASGSQLATRSYSYGIMTGTVNNNSVAYSISLPNDANKIWNMGNNSYSATGTGSIQNIALNAKIVPGNSSSLFPAQDFYLDTVTAVITY